MWHNPKYEDLHAPLQGPHHPVHGDVGVSRATRNHAQGHVQTVRMNQFTFDEQHATFQAQGWAAEPSGRGFVGDMNALREANADTVYGMNRAKRQKMRDQIIAEMASHDDGEKPDFSAWAPARDAMPPLKTTDLT